MVVDFRSFPAILPKLMDILNLTAKQLRQGAALKEQIESLQTELNQLLDGVVEQPQTVARGTPKRTMSAAGRARIAAAAKARWAKFRKQKGAASASSAPQPKRKMSAAARARLSAIAKARWKKAKRAGKIRL